ncbi:MAG: hypothetical protein ABJP02_04960 [Parasphingorhabdus sp.]|uniref:hypothetical protein n=1 Tax=Parasphingorhabdus sp. TaxID=2709688 RepID=UPI003299B883
MNAVKLDDQPICKSCRTVLRRNPRRKEDICSKCKSERKEQEQAEKLKRRQEQKGIWSKSLSAPPEPKLKGKKKRGKKASAGSSKGSVHPLIVQADIPAVQGKRYDHKVDSVPNPHGEVVVRGKLRQHKAVRRVAHFETLYRSKVFDHNVFKVLEWYDEKQSLAASGLIKCGIDNSGGGIGTAHPHITTNLAAMEARSDIDWARSFIPPDLLPAFDGVMVDGDTFEAIGRGVYASVSVDRARRKASSAFKIAANYLLAGIGPRVGVHDIELEKAG